MALLRTVSTAVAVLAAVVGATPAWAGCVGAGTRAPDAMLQDWDGKPAPLAGHRGHVVLLDFWASWCTPCRVALPGIDAIARRHRDADVLAANIDATRAPADRFLAERLPHPVFTLRRDPNGDVLARFGASGMPAVYLIDRDGVVRLAESGYDPARLDEIEQALERLLAACPADQGSSTR